MNNLFDIKQTIHKRWFMPYTIRKHIIQNIVNNYYNEDNFGGYTMNQLEYLINNKILKKNHLLLLINVIIDEHLLKNIIEKNKDDRVVVYSVYSRLHKILQ